jgi:hypothetical protein
MASSVRTEKGAAAMSAEQESCRRDPLEQIAASFLARLRSGEQPAVSEYEAMYPDLADDIRSLFPPLMMGRSREWGFG